MVLELRAEVGTGLKEKCIITTNIVVGSVSLDLGQEVSQEVGHEVVKLEMGGWVRLEVVRFGVGK